MARGRLRIYLGAAPGVGKTFAMLGEGHRRHDRGTDVVVGFVETHGRANTAAQLGDLEIVPRRSLEHRGTAFEEMDVDAVLARRPAVALVDELAHSNVPGSRNEKRWQDVAELLDAGIDVISTVNIQHLESVNDVVERITGVVQRERVPDEVVRSAEQVEVVDMTPEALRRRLAHGNVYAADKIDAALTNYFRPGNLTALRELALLWVADRVDASLDEYRERHGISTAWETRERVVVAITGAPGGEHLLRRAARIAQRSHGVLLGVHVRRGDGLARDARGAIEEHRQLLIDLGGTFHEVVGVDVAETIVEFARSQNATQIVLGASRRSRWSELAQGSVIARVVRASGSIDVHVISHESDDADRTRAALPVRRQAPLPPRRRNAGWLFAFVALPLLTAILAAVRDDLHLASHLFLYLLAVVAIAVVGGRLPAITSAVAAFLLANWYLTPPVHTWTVSERENLLALVVFVVVAAVVSSYVAIAAARTLEAERARAEAEVLLRLSTSFDESDPLGAVVDSLRSTFALDAAAVLHRDADGAWAAVAAAGPVPAAPESGDTFELFGDDLALVLTGPMLTADDRRILTAFAAHLEAVLERRELADAAARAVALDRANALRTALLQAVSHDLRTPLAAIKAAVSSLRAPDVEWDAGDEAQFLATIEEATDHLTTLVTNLLDLSRLQAGVVTPAIRPVGLDEVVPVALDGITGFDGRSPSIALDLPDGLPDVAADPVLLERVVANLAKNALRFDRSGTRVRASRHGDSVQLHVIDHGPGIPAELRDLVLQPFQRLGDQRTDGGVGLGLAVVRGFVTAMHGELLLEDTPGGGLTAVVTLPVAT